MNILLINHYAGSPALGMEYRPYYMAKEWRRCGHNVTIVGASYSHLRVQSPSVRESVKEEWIDGIRYVWVRTPPYSGNGLGRVRNILSFVFGILRGGEKIVGMWRPDVVIGASTYQLDIFAVRRIARKYSARIVYEIRDLWPLSLIELAGMSRWNPFVLLVGWAEQFMLSESDKIVSALPCADEYLEEHRISSSKLTYVPNGVDVWGWDEAKGALPQEHQDVFEELRSQGKFILGYAGSHGVANTLDSLMDAATLLEEGNVTIVMVGQGPLKCSLQEKARTFKRGNVVFLASVGRAMVPQLLSQFDVCYIGWKRNNIYRYGVSPNKLFDYMMARRPVIHATSARIDIVAKSGCGISVPPEDPQAIASAVRFLQALPAAERLRIGALGRKYIIENHNYQTLATQFLEVLQR